MIHTNYWAMCDFTDGCTEDREAAVAMPKTIAVPHNIETLELARNYLRDRGWSVAGGKFLCPVHADQAGKR